MIKLLVLESLRESREKVSKKLKVSHVTNKSRVASLSFLPLC